LSLFFGASRGLVWSWLQQRRNRHTLRTQAVLSDLYGLASQHSDPRHPHNVEVLRAMNRYQGGVRHSLGVLQSAGLVKETSAGQWALTDSGADHARRLVSSNGGEE
jgi:manganese/zinc/iron transport system permease protein